MKQENMTFFHLVVAAVFICMLLTFSVVYAVDTFVVGSSPTAAACYDGTVIEGDGIFARLRRTVYQNSKTLSFIRDQEYNVFGIVNHPNVVAGKKDFLFNLVETDTKQNGYYNYLEDHIGEARFTDEEMAKILENLKARERIFAARNTQYLLVVIPNAQTVYPEYMPSELGAASPNTRLSRLDEYLSRSGFNSFLNLTDSLLQYKSENMLLYNNTENSLNALGLYYTYLSVYGCFSDSVKNATNEIKMDELTFYVHDGTGKDIAREAMLSDTVANQTVSLSDSTVLKYTTYLNQGFAAYTRPTEPYTQEFATAPSLLLQFSSQWDRLQIEPFFSNTFGRVTYQTGLSYNAQVVEKANPAVVIQFIHENELGQLLNNAVAHTYK